MAPSNPKLEKIIIYTDGASRSNPGAAASAWVVCDEKGNVLRERAIYLGTATNNVAEYRAVIEGLKAGVSFCRWKALVRSDSQLVVNQMNGTFRVKAEHLLPLLQEVHAAAALYTKGVTYEHRSRSTPLIARADRLCNECLDAAG